MLRGKPVGLIRIPFGRKPKPKYSNTGIELAVRAVLIAERVAYRQQAFLGSWPVDFYIPKLKLVIECDGDYYHHLPGAPEKDLRRTQWLRDHGYRIVRLTETEINRDVKGCVKKALRG